ncbi:MAG: hypothetical protein Q8O12_06905 [Candidatus Omnitrophota bacterium]|nr:hypothetical protein [Candidatus Omnitrophota bacterium]
MQKRYWVVLSLIISICCIAQNNGFAATVGNSLDLDIPERSAILREQAVDQALDSYEQAIKLTASFDAEFIFNKDLHTTSEVTGAELKGNWYMAKLGITILNRVQPYIKIGTSDLETEWKQGSTKMEVDADGGFAIGGGLKAKIWEFEDLGLRLTGDVQYRTTEPDAGTITVSGTRVTDPGATFDVNELQASLLVSKKFEIPLKWQSVYAVPYTGVSYADSNVDVHFVNTVNPGLDSSLFKANNKKCYGYVLGCDIVPSLSSAFIYSIELRLVDETALSLGGTMKF